MTERVPDQVLRLDDGRRLGFCVWGDPAGTPLLFLHGTPGSRLMFSIGHACARALGLALVAPDRWGYGLSDAPAEPALPRFAADMAALMDHLGHQRFAVAGVSGGGPYAASVAAGLGARVTALALISPVGPIADIGCGPSLHRFHRFCFTQLSHYPLVTAAVFRFFRWTLNWSPHLAGQLATLRGCRADKAVIAQPGTSERLFGSFSEGLRPGQRGPVTDIAVFSRPWGVDLAAISAPTRLWLGTADNAVPLIAARALADLIPGCRYEELAGEGHLWVATNYPHVLEWVRAVARSGVPAAAVDR